MGARWIKKEPSAQIVKEQSEMEPVVQHVSGALVSEPTPPQSPLAVCSMENKSAPVSTSLVHDSELASSGCKQSVMAATSATKLSTDDKDVGKQTLIGHRKPRATTQGFNELMNNITQGKKKYKSGASVSGMSRGLLC